MPDRGGRHRLHPDEWSAPLIVAAARLLASPRSAAALASGAVESYRISPGAIALARMARGEAG